MIAALRHLLFPDFCLHCDEGIENQKTVFCSACMQLLEWIDPNMRCRFCFAPLENPEYQTWCGECLKQRNRIAAAMEYKGPAGTMLRALKYSSRHDLAKIAAAKMVVQWEKLNWPLPEVLLPIPSRGAAVRLIAKEMGTIFKVPVLQLLSRSFFALPQHRLSADVRKKLGEDVFTMKTTTQLAGRIVFLIDDVLTTGATLKSCMEKAEEGFPKKMYGLVFCSGMQ